MCAFVELLPVADCYEAVTFFVEEGDEVGVVIEPLCYGFEGGFLLLFVGEEDELSEEEEVDFWVDFFLVVVLFFDVFFEFVE